MFQILKDVFSAEFSFHRWRLVADLCSGNGADSWSRCLQLSRKLLAYGSLLSQKAAYLSGARIIRYTLCTLQGRSVNELLVEHSMLCSPVVP